MPRTGPLEVGKVIVATHTPHDAQVRTFGELAAAVEDIEKRAGLDPGQTRALVRAAIEARYTLAE